MPSPPQNVHQQLHWRDAWLLVSVAGASKCQRHLYLQAVMRRSQSNLQPQRYDMIICPW